MKILLYLGVFCILFVGFVRYIESQSIFYPRKHISATPKEIDLVFDDVYFKAADQTSLHGWFIEGRKENGVLLFFHGNAGNISDRLAKIQMFHQLGLNIFIVDYRGYGKSEGNPSEKGMYLDAQGAFDYLIKEKGFLENKIVIYGASLGGAVAVDLAMNRKTAALIVDSSFTSALDMAKRIYPFVPGLRFLLKTKLDSLSKVKNIDTPKLFIHSEEDEIVPFELGERLYDAASQPKSFTKIRGGHNDGHVYDADKFMAAINIFLTDLKLIQ